MISRVAYRKQPGRRLLTGLAVAGLIAGTFAFTTMASASTPANLFELDGNAVTNHAGTGLPDDWDRVFNGTTNGAIATSFVDDRAVSVDCAGGNNCSIFTGGGSKDPIDTSSWAWKTDTGGLPDKDNLQHGFAARYSIPSSTACPGPGGDTTGATNCSMLFFGNDRFDNSGDAQQGFWFFQNAIAPTAGGSFTGVHKDGDLLLISDFSIGGTTSTITVYTWDHTCLKAASNSPTPGQCGDTNLRLQATSTAANCSVADPALVGFCGIVNAAGGTVSPWPFLDKSGNTTFAQGEFYEGGVNLSHLNLQSECFSTVASETRSSQSTSATLKDFVMGSFAPCGATFSTTPSITTSAIPTTGTLSVTDNATLNVTGIATWSGSLDFYLCGPSATTCDTSGTKIGSTKSVNQNTSIPITSDSATVTSVGTYCWAGVFTSATNGVPSKTDASSGECFTVTPVTPTLTTKATTSVLIGNPISDTATLSGTANKPGSPVINPTVAGLAAGGSITFKLYGPEASATCAAADLVFTSSAISVSGDGTAYNSGSFTPTSAGTYFWTASYTGDSPNTNGQSTACGDAGESTVVNPGQPTISTTATAGPVTLGSAISDTAHLGNLSTPSNATQGTITFTAYGPATTTTDCSTSVYTSTVNVTGNGDYGSASGSGGVFTPTAPGTYNWIAAYTPATGDANNKSATTSCGDASEASVVISIQPEMSSVQSFIPNDKATVTASAGGDLAGSVTFKLYESSDCSGTAIDTETVPVSGASPQSVKTANTTHSTTSTVVSWLISYASTNPAQKSIGATCLENSAITYNNGGTTP